MRRHNPPSLKGREVAANAQKYYVISTAYERHTMHRIAISTAYEKLTMHRHTIYAMYDKHHQVDNSENDSLHIYAIYDKQHQVDNNKNDSLHAFSVLRERCCTIPMYAWMHHPEWHRCKSPTWVHRSFCFFLVCFCFWGRCMTRPFMHASSRNGAVLSMLAPCRSQVRHCILHRKHTSHTHTKKQGCYAR